MLRFLKVNIVLFCIGFYGITINAQTKFEREYRIKPHEIPKPAGKFINQVFEGQKIKWYAEESQDGKTFEAKTTYKKNKYSIEFDTHGNVIDVEQKVSFQSLEDGLKSKIRLTFNTLFTKHIILKTQIQWKGDANTLFQLLKNQNAVGYTQLYEIIVKAKKEDTYKMYEVLVDSDGKAIKVLEIVQRTSDNLEF